MRIVGGKFAGRRLSAVGSGAPEAHLRPTPDRVREALFNVIAHGDHPPLEGARVLDLFAGSGALGFEALSRGAARVLFVDDHPKARALIRETIETLGVAGETKLFRRDATRLGPWRAEPFSHLFLDPPYRKDLGPAALRSAVSGGWVAPGAFAALEIAGDEAPPELSDFERVDLRRYGDTQILLLRRRPD